jgi:hypothetical protein
MNFEVAQTSASPFISANGDDGRVIIRGDSYPENSFELFRPLIAWVETYLAQPRRPLRFEVELLYMNTSSVRAMMDIFDLLESAFQNGTDVGVVWLYDAGNERVAELAEEFKEDCTFPFEITAKARMP